MEENIKSIMVALDQRDLQLALYLIQQELKSRGYLGKYSVSIANRLMGVFPWDIISKLLPSGTCFFETSGWVNSINRNAPLDVSDRPLPWLNYSCIDFIGNFLGQRSANIFEWGSGYSTLFFQEHSSKVRSCEDNKEWFDTVYNLASNAKNLELVYRPTKAEYLGEIAGSFDLIVVDGSYRSECLKLAPNFIKSDGLILLDNSDDANLDDSILDLDRRGFYSITFTGLIPSYAYKNVSTVFFRDPMVLRSEKGRVPSSTAYSSGITCFQAMEKLRCGSDMNRTGEDKIQS